MTSIRDHEFPTSEPVRLFVELGVGKVAVHAAETTTSTVHVEGPGADEVRVEQSGRQLSVIGPKQRGLTFGGGAKLSVTITVPTSSQVSTKTGSADVDLDGELAAVQLRSGSGDMSVELATGPAVLETGSGNIRVGEAGADLRLKSGSGDVSVGQAGRSLVASTGSGDVEVGTTRGPVSVKTGSGDLRVNSAADDVTLTTGSGDLEVRSVGSGRITGKGASGDIKIAVPAGVPVWTDVTTAHGRIQSSLRGAGQPVDGQDHIEIRARTASGDITLVEL
ncbi:Putative adhesin [Nocardioides terrae]|uniref:Putative adhesin n=1 Tax=Nocardioides terrae TaxID=574651 RepID=A0A1I1ET79_9ACTN|nr:DUF4097 family beta strand repeat-containing protein [Nocardioides terrae]SFB90335.1 Putative adhesin [Nocardioides terrae]